MDVSKRRLKKCLSDSNPRDLIWEIKKRPGIYDKDNLEQPRRENRHRLWLEVAENVTMDWMDFTEAEKEARIDEVQHKWKHLRNHFLRLVKVVESGKSGKKPKYKYFDDMEFIRPYIGIKPPRASTKTKTGTGREEKEYYTEAEDSDTTMDHHSSFEEVRMTSPIEEKHSRVSSTRVSRITPNSRKLTRQEKLVIDRFDGLGKVAQNISPSLRRVPDHEPLPSVSMRDGDVSFCLSLVPTMRKLDESKRLKAKIEILTILQKYVIPEKKLHLSMRAADSSHRIDEDMDGFKDESVNDSSEEERSTNAWWT